MPASREELIRTACSIERGRLKRVCICSPEWLPGGKRKTADEGQVGRGTYGQVVWLSKWRSFPSRLAPSQSTQRGLLGQKLLSLAVRERVKGGNKRDSKRALEEEKQWVALLLGEREKSLFEKIDAFERDKSDLT